MITPSLIKGICRLLLSLSVASIGSLFVTTDTSIMSVVLCVCFILTYLIFQVIQDKIDKDSISTTNRKRHKLRIPKNTTLTIEVEQ